MDAANHQLTKLLTAGAGEAVQPPKCLPSEHETLGVCPTMQVESQVYAYIPVLGRRQEEPRMR